MTLNIQRAGDITASTKYKFFLHGASGAGKTWTVCTAPKPLIVLTEPQGLHTIQLAKPDAGVIECNNPDQVRAVVRAALNDEFTKAGYETLAFDGMTEIQRMFKDELTKGRKRDSDFTQKDWGLLQNRMLHFTRTIRDLPMHVACTAQGKTLIDDGVKYFFPILQGSFGDEVLGFFTIGAYLYKTIEEGLEKYHAMVGGPSRVVCKPTHPLVGTVDPDIAAWIEALQTKTPIEKPAEGESEEEEPEAEPKTKNKKGSKK